MLELEASVLELERFGVMHRIRSDMKADPALMQSTRAWGNVGNVYFCTAQHAHGLLISIASYRCVVAGA